MPWLVRHTTWLLNRFQRTQNGATAFENLKRVSYKKPLMQIGERCHWLEAERITHMYDPRWGTGVWLGRHSASDAHLIGTPGGVIHVVVLETIRTGAMRVVHITVNIEETQKLRIKFVLVLSYLNSNTTSINNLHCTVLPVHTNTSKSTFPSDN